MENRNEEYQPLLPEYRLLPRRITRENADAKLTEVRMRRATESQREAVHFDRRVPISWPCCLWPPWAAVRQPVHGRWDVPEGQSRVPFQAKLQHTLPVFAPFG